MKITTVLCAINFVALEMILLVTTHVIKMETKPAGKVGWEKNVNKVLCLLHFQLYQQPNKTAVGISVVSMLQPVNFN